MAIVKSKLRAAEYNNKFIQTAGMMARSRKQPFTVDDVVAKLGNPPQGRKALGALMAAAVRRHNLHPVEEIQSQAESRRGSYVVAWKQGR